MFGVRRVVPANSRLSPTKPGAVPLAQFKLSLKLLSPPAPFHTSLPTATVNGILTIPLSEAVSVRVTTSVSPPAGMLAATDTVLVQTLPPAETSITELEPPMALALRVALLTVPQLPLVAVTLMKRFWLRRAVTGVAVPAPVGPAQ